MSLRVTIAATMAVVVVAAPALAGDKYIPKKMGFAEKDGFLVVTSSFTELFDERAYEGLSSGFEHNVVLRAYIYRDGGDMPVASTAATYRVIYDLWDESYDVQLIDPRGVVNWRFSSRADTLRAITEAHELPLASLRMVPVGEVFYCKVVVELNPVSDEALAEMRRWLTRRAGAERLASNASFFGTVVSVFVNPKLDQADAALTLTSQRFFRPKSAPVPKPKDH